MSIIESIGVALFFMVIVFLVLFALYFCIKLFSGLVARIERTFTR